MYNGITVLHNTMKLNVIELNGVQPAKLHGIGLLPIVKRKLQRAICFDMLWRRVHALGLPIPG